MNSIPIANHIAKAKDRLIEQYKGKIRLEALLESIVDPLQEIEDLLNALGSDRWIDSAYGVQLDKVGKVVGAFGIMNQYIRIKQVRGETGINPGRYPPFAEVKIQFLKFNPFWSGFL